MGPDLGQLDDHTSYPVGSRHYCVWLNCGDDGFAGGKKAELVTSGEKSELLREPFFSLFFLLFSFPLPLPPSFFPVFSLCAFHFSTNISEAFTICQSLNHMPS